MSLADRRTLLDIVAQATDEGGGLLAVSVLQLLGGCGRTHLPADILQARAPVAGSQSGTQL